MAERIALGGISVDVVKKDIKNIHLSVYPPTGRVRISAPWRMSSNAIRLFAISKLGWIKRQQKKLREQERETLREFLDRESHYLWEKRYLLKVIEKDALPGVRLKHSILLLQVRPGASEDKKEMVISGWYREQLKEAVAPLITKWEPLLGVKVKRVFVQKMKTKWGGCNTGTKTIRLNTELAKKPPECLEYIVLHEMVHLLVRHHNDRFTSLMDQFLPNWKLIRQTLNRAPLPHADWTY